MGAFLLDLRHSLRMLSKAPVFTAVAVVTLALGIGANSAVFSFVSATLLRALPLPDPSRVVVLREYNPEKRPNGTTASLPDVEDWARQSRTIEHFGAWRDWHGFKIATSGGTESVPSSIASPEFFQALGVKPALGRFFLPEENQAGRDQVCVLSNSFWRSRLGGDEGVVGKQITLDKKSYTVVGVLPADFETLDAGWAKIWAPASIDPDQTLGRHARNRQVYARLKPGVTLEAARAEMETIQQGLAAQYPNEDAGWRVKLSRLQDEEVAEVRPALLAFLGATALVLLIACANVTNLFLARAAARRKEFAIRASLGANKVQVLRQLLTESLVLSFVGGALGLLLAAWLVDLFGALAPNVLPGSGRAALDARVLAFTFALATLTGVVFGLAPALSSFRLNLVEVLKDGVTGAESRRRFRLREVLVVAQVALAVTLLVGAGLLSKTFLMLTKIQPGFNPQNLLTVQLFMPDDKFKDRGSVVGFWRQARETLKTIPGVESVGTVSAGAQFGGVEPIEWMPEGGEQTASGGYPQARYFDASPDYFRTMQIPVLRGREFTDADDSAAPLVAVVNETLARRYFEGDAIGKRIVLPRAKETLEIVGVVGDTLRYGLDSKVEPEIYWPQAQSPRRATYFILRTGESAAGILAAVRSRVAQIEPEVSVSNASTMDALVAKSLKRPRFHMVLLLAFAATALVLAAVGLYGVISYSVSRRTREMGIRLALGAQPRSVLRMVMRETLTQVLVGVVLGLVGAQLATRALTGMLFGVGKNDPLTVGLVALLVVAVAAVAGYIPATRAARVDPMIALRYE